jgi:hypothetical protein
VHVRSYSYYRKGYIGAEHFWLTYGLRNRLRSNR